jgi:hypothetical protein
MLRGLSGIQSDRLTALADGLPYFINYYHILQSLLSRNAQWLVVHNAPGHLVHLAGLLVYTPEFKFAPALAPFDATIR